MTPTIRVSRELRDRLKAQASRDGLTLSAHLVDLVDAEDRRRRLQEMKAAIAASSVDAVASHARESADWERTERATSECD